MIMLLLQAAGAAWRPQAHQVVDELLVQLVEAAIPDHVLPRRHQHAAVAAHQLLQQLLQGSTIVVCQVPVSPCGEKEQAPIAN